MKEFVMSTFPSTSSMSNVSPSPHDFIEQFVSALGKKFDESQKATQELLFNINEQVHSLDKGKGIDHRYYTKDLNSSSSAAPTSTQQPLYGMPPNFSLFFSLPPNSVHSWNKLE